LPSLCAAQLNYSLTMLSLVKVDTQKPVAQRISATKCGRVGFRSRVASLLQRDIARHD
jgi:hypothetical protein